MASDGTWVFVLGGESSETALGDETAHIYVFDTSTYFVFVISFEQLWGANRGGREGGEDCIEEQGYGFNMCGEIGGQAIIRDIN